VGSVIGDFLPSAVGVAISPIPIIAVILMLFGPGARSTGPAFAVGWVTGLLVVGGLAMTLADSGDASTDESASDAVYWIKFFFGLLFIALAVRQWKARPKEGEEPQMPRWMGAIDSFTPVKAFGLAALLAGVNPKNLGLSVAAGTTIAQAGLSGADSVISLIVFVVLGSATVALPVGYYLLFGPSAERTLNSLKGWLMNNNATVMFILFVVLGCKLLGDGFGGVTA